MRTREQLREHYLIERELADRLRRADRDERTTLYAEVYDELFQRVPDHPQLHPDNEARNAWIQAETRRLARFVHPGDTFVEIGAGDCALSIAMAERAGQVFAVDVSDEIVPKEGLPPNVEVVLSDGRSIPVAPATADVVYSNQLMEHLHPDDAEEQLRNIATALRPGGRYVCVTPHRFAGPSDISSYFDDVATGFHLREYTVGEIERLFKAAGFSKVQSVLSVKVSAFPVPTAIARSLEAVLVRMPPERRKRVGRSALRRLLGVSVVATR